MMKIRLLPIFRCLLASALVAGCGSLSSVPFVSGGKDRNAQAVTQGISPDLEEAVETSTSPAPPPAAPRFTRSDFTGQPAATVDALLGAPRFVRNEGRGQYRRYANSLCNLVVILYPDTGTMQVVRSLHASRRQSGDPQPALQDCLNAF